MPQWIRDDGRFYAAYAQQDLLGDWSVVKIWGGQARNTSNQDAIYCESYQEAIELLDQIKKRRIERGYLPIFCALHFRLRARNS